jgi:hypothetical protein
MSSIARSARPRLGSMAAPIDAARVPRTVRRVGLTWHAPWYVLGTQDSIETGSSSH